MPFVLSAFSPTHFNRKIHSRHSTEASKCAGGRGSSLPPIAPLFDPPISSTRQISDFLASKRGLNLVRSFDVPSTLVRGLKLQWVHEVLEFDFVGIPASSRRYANSHRFLRLTIVTIRFCALSLFY
ncbi:hypothetical protein AVEN_262385-1 [Araneus ventricosus]|uniref:Uncharacterized protein n=1 Tax=Araneus ventricosus TaxID=182803 RepID=A0A4Y2IJY7_ARAVE|nr:hypothetical protein AVEN_262385-1 [Araneus ventricosus]